MISRPRLALAVAATLAACTELEEPVRPEFARTAAGPTVTATDPSFGHRGDVGVAVTITGTGFDQGSVASWQRSGVTDPKVIVKSTQFVSSTQLKATVDVAPDATLSLYDVVVTTHSGRKGIGTLLFEVTQAQVIAGTESASGANELGQMAGRIGSPGAFFYSPVSGVYPFGTPGSAHDLSEDGTVVAGGTGFCCDGAFAWINGDSAGTVAWHYYVLPKTQGAFSNGAHAVGSNAAGANVFVGGVDTYSAGGNKYIRYARLWTPPLSGSAPWGEVVLPPGVNGTESYVFDVNGIGTAAGTVGGNAAVWQHSGTGLTTADWTVTTFGPNGSKAWGINAAGTIAVGYVTGSGQATVARYWTLSGATWAEHPLPGGCTEAVDIDASGRILANGCPNGNRNVPALISAPYASQDVRLLGSLGSSASATSAKRMSANGAWIAGSATYKNQSVGVRWAAGLP